ncbi:hypothetical protein EVU91_05325 [Macrococcoides bohemicum]|uniref:hypothetical protein n=1 Tax=Macrococcoides bohemicum TaxID=1903056 RepID=UPI001059CE98|nr:hypothetical protein [Macrococcus bohemicus]TDL38326.1 hypothetical protein EVU91_05325 [Macrococcus bohemicus]
MDLLKRIFGLVYVFIPLIYLIVYSIFEVFRKDEVMNSLIQILPVVALYYIFISIIGYFLFNKIIEKVNDTINHKKSLK